MPQHGNITYAKISVFAHATEDPEKVAEAVKTLLPMLRERGELISTEMQGHHGNPILRIEGDFEMREDAFEALDLLLSRLSTLDEDILRREFHEHLDAKGNLYLRFDKQQAFLGQTSLGTNDPISLRVRLGFQPRSLDELKLHLEEKKRISSGDRRIGQGA